MLVAIAKIIACCRRWIFSWDQEFWILQKDGFTSHINWALLKIRRSITEEELTSLHSASVPNYLRVEPFFFFFLFPNNTLTFCRTYIALNRLCKKSYGSYSINICWQLWGTGCADGDWVGDRWYTQPFVNLSSLWLQIRPQEMTEDCFWVKANENKYESVDLLCKLENIFCCQPKRKFNILVICCF